MFDDEIMGGFDAAELGRKVRPQTPEDQLKAFLKTLSPAERKQYLANMRQNAPQPEPQPAARAMPMLWDHGMNQAVGAFNMAGAMAGRHAGQLGGMADKATDAIRDENDRRVALSREMRRMEHERALKKMEQDTERMKIDALLQRLRMEGGAMPRASGEGFAIY